MRTKKSTPKDNFIQRRLDAVLAPLPLGITLAANYQESLRATRTSKAVSLLPAGIRSAQEMRRRAYINPGAFFGGDLPKGMAPMPDWTEDQWTTFWKKAGWTADAAAAMAAGVQPSEFAGL